MYSIIEFYLLVILEIVFFIKMKQYISGCWNLITRRQTDRQTEADRQADRKLASRVDKVCCVQV